MRTYTFIYLLLSILSFWGNSGASAQTIRIGIHPEEELEHFTYQALGDEVWVMVGDSFPNVIAKLNTLDKVEVFAYKGRIRIKFEEQELGRYKTVRFWCNDRNPKFNLLLDSRKKPMITYPDHLEVKLVGAHLHLINETFIENYLEGVVHAEVGHHKSLEFFKVQAVSARTYALRHLGKHGKAGFDLCDRTHCQAFHGLPKSAHLIERAVGETEGEVIVFDGKLIEAVFSGNCGGYTANSEDVWVNKVEYLRSMPDYDFCEGFNNHAWHVMVSKWDFLEKIGQYHKITATSYEIEPDVSGRVKRIYANKMYGYPISGEELRYLFKLKSSKFHVYEFGNLLFIEGAGFGHGVGMCQDGGFYLSEIGMDYDKIIKHYYQGVEITPLKVLSSEF